MNYKEKINSIMSLMNKGLFEKAISELNLCLSQEIKTEEVYYLIGSANIYLGKLKDSIKYFKLVIPGFSIKISFTPEEINMSATSHKLRRSTAIIAFSNLLLSTNSSRSPNSGS